MANHKINANVGVAGALYQTENGTDSGIGVFMPMVQGGMSVTNSSSTTGRLRIKVPTYKSLAMQTFYIDVYEYDTDRSATYRVSGYNYNDTNATWYNTSAVALFDSDNRDLTVRFGADTSANEQYVSIGETNTSWTYVQVVVRDYFGGYSTSVSEATAAFRVEFVTTDAATYNVNHDNNQPFANWSKIESIPSNVTNALPTTGGTMSGAIAMGANKITGLGTPTANTTDAANTAYVDAAITTGLATVIASAPALLDTLDELAAALGDDENFKKAYKHFTGELGLTHDDAMKRLESMGYDEKLPEDKVRLVENPKKFMKDYVETVLSKRSDYKEIVNDSEKEINPILKRQLDSLKKTLKKNNLTVSDITKLLDDNE